ncbi:MAG TPA: YraN family protein [Acidobacteriaceae bacterium]|jgi:putative endonuclease|nr:YraN family protein [Acidobacteriaceae bacterium]
MFFKLRVNLMESAVEALHRASTRHEPATAPHLATGVRGERAAFFWLRRNGYLVVARGWRSSRAPGDLDLIAWQGETLCFIEVKTRTTHAVAPAELAVDRGKRRTLRRLARHYLRQLPNRDVATRFDILSIYREGGKAPEFELFDNAFGWVEAQR